MEINPQSGGKDRIPEEEVEKAEKKIIKSPNNRKLVLKSCSPQMQLTCSGWTLLKCIIPELEQICGQTAHS